MTKWRKVQNTSTITRWERDGVEVIVGYGPGGTETAVRIGKGAAYMRLYDGDSKNEAFRRARTFMRLNGQDVVDVLGGTHQGGFL